MMSSSITTAPLWTAALGSDFIAGVYFAFSVFIMQAVGKIDDKQAIAAMNSINETILRSGLCRSSLVRRLFQYHLLLLPSYIGVKRVPG